ncbi:MAG TPA: hypothetical protein EYQ80_06300 [Candidatus Poseidoniales archaeon]|nr:hypothetical protein [Candidatus Poseidoniales archaeon]
MSIFDIIPIVTMGYCGDYNHSASASEQNTDSTPQLVCESGLKVKLLFLKNLLDGFSSAEDGSD